MSTTRVAIEQSLGLGFAAAGDQEEGRCHDVAMESRPRGAIPVSSVATTLPQAVFGAVRSCPELTESTPRNVGWCSIRASRPDRAGAVRSPFAPLLLIRFSRLCAAATRRRRSAAVTCISEINSRSMI